MRILLPVLCFLLTLSAAANDSTYVLKRLSPVPVRVNGQSNVKLDLNGSWYFNPAPKNLSLTDQNYFSGWKKIEVPGEWVMQGFKVAKKDWAVYSRTFKVPADWKRSRVKLRCDGVYSECTVFINGRQIGHHLGGFTPFEFDVTDFARPGAKSVITIKVKNESLADSLASGSQYAVHALGGITRKIYLMQMPELNFSMFHVQTDFDASYENGALKTQLEIINESPEKVQHAAVLFELEEPITKKVVLKRKIDVTDLLKDHGTAGFKTTISYDINSILKAGPTGSVTKEMLFEQFKQLIAKDQLTKLWVYMSISDAATIAPVDDAPALGSSGDFSKDRVYTVRAADGSTKSYIIQTVKGF